MMTTMIVDSATHNSIEIKKYETFYFSATKNFRYKKINNKKNSEKLLINYIHTHIIQNYDNKVLYQRILKMKLTFDEIKIILWMTNKKNVDI